MTDKNNLDMFKLAEEVEKQKKQAEMSLDDIFSDLDNVTKDQVYTPKPENTQRVIKPSIPNRIGDYTTRYEAFKGIIENVSYGTNNAEEYVRGHRDAVEQCSTEAYKHRKNISVYEDMLNRQLAEYPSRYKLYEKGFYDGMFYVLKAIKRSKELAMDNLVKELRKEL